VGGRGQDYDGLGVSAEGRHQRLHEQVDELRRLWAGEPVLDGAPPLGPGVVQPGGPPLYAGATGPRSLRRCARWAVGVSGFSFGLDAGEVAGAVADARAAWSDVGAPAPPRIVVGCFFVLSDDDTSAAEELATFTYEYLEVFGERAARGLTKRATLSSPSRLHDALATLAASGDVDAVILVPGTVDPRCAELAADVVGDVALLSDEI